MQRIKNENKVDEYLKLKEISKTRKLTSKEKIIIKTFELDKLKEEEKEATEKQKKVIIKGINRVVNQEIEKKYNEIEDPELDLKIASILIYIIENYKEYVELVNKEEYVERNKRGGIIRKIKEKKELGENKHENISSYS